MRAVGASPGGDSVGAGSRADGAPANQRAPIRLSIRDEWDVVIARKHARELARDAGLSESAAAALATAISEIAQNVVTHAGCGEVSLGIAEEQGRRCVVVEVRDDGPGIADSLRAMEDGYSTAGGLGLGLASARRLVDTFDLASAAGNGTTVVLKKW